MIDMRTTRLPADQPEDIFREENLERCQRAAGDGRWQGRRIILWANLRFRVAG